MRDDYRALYIAWIVALQTGDIEETELKEKAIPPGFRDLSHPLESLIDFYELEQDLVASSAVPADIYTQR